MIDIHCHIIPDVDDGARGWEEGLAMGRAAAADGVEVVVATPHFDHPMFRTDPVRADDRRTELGRRLAGAGVAVQLVRGGEVTVSAQTAERLEAGEVPHLGPGPYFLLELCNPIPAGLEQALFAHRLAGRIPILAHVEREPTFQRSPELLHRLVSQGTLCQVTAMSVTGDFGSKAARASRLLIEKGMVHFIASDAHGADKRPPGLSRAVEVAAKLLGSPERARALVEDNPRYVIEGRTLEPEPPLPLKKSWF